MGQLPLLGAHVRERKTVALERLGWDEVEPLTLLRVEDEGCASALLVRQGHEKLICLVGHLSNVL